MSEENNNFDSLVDGIIQKQEEVTKEEFEKNRIKSAKEIAKNELFAITPTVNMQQVNESLGKAPYLERMSKEGAEVEIVEPHSPTSKSLDDYVAKEQTTTKRVSKSKKQQINPAYTQESIDLSQANMAFLGSTQDSSNTSFRKKLSKLIKDEEFKTQPFQVNTIDDNELVVEEIAPVNDVPMPTRDFDESVGPQSVDDFGSLTKRTYTPKTAIDDTVNYIYLNKCVFATMLTVFALCLIETAVMYFVISSVAPIPTVFYYIALLVAMIPLGVGIFRYSFNPSYAVRKKFNYLTMFLNAFICVILCVVLMIIIILLSSISLVNPQDYVPKIILPSLFIINIPFGVIAFVIFSKVKLFHVNKSYK